MEKDPFSSDDLFSSTPRSSRNAAASESLLGDLESLISVLEKPQDGVDIPILKSFASEEELLTTLAEDIPVLSDMVAMEVVDEIVPILTEESIFDTPEMLAEEPVLMPPEQHDLGSVSTHYNVAEMIEPVADEVIPQASSSAFEGDLSWTQAEQILRTKAGVYIQELVDELIPQVEDKLRKRLQEEFDVLLKKTKQARKL